MARIRTIKPEFWADEKLAPLPPIDRLVFLGLVSLADDAGRLVDSVRQLDGMLFPFSDETCGPSLDTLARLSRIRRYTSGSGQRLIQIVGWEKHQYVDRPAKYVLPPPPPEAHTTNGVTETSREPRENLATVSRDPIAPTLDLGPTTYDLRPGSVDLPRAPAHARGEGLAIPNGNGTHPPPPSDELAAWLGPYANVLDDCPPAATPRSRRTLLQHYGPPAMRSGAWAKGDGGTVPTEDRPGLFALALSGYAAEGNLTIRTNEFAAMLRRTIADEQTLPRGPTAAPLLTPAQRIRYREIRRELEDGGMGAEEAAVEAGQRAGSE